MDRLTANQESFIKLMSKSDEHARHGFELLLERPDFEKFFDALNEAGMFESSKNPAPVSTDDPRYARIPYWAVLDYLLRCAKLAGEINDSQLACKVLNIVRNVSGDRESDGKIKDNYHTFRVFAEILGLIPLSTITVADIDLIPAWLESKFDNSMVGHALDIGLLRKLLLSESADDWSKAGLALKYCTAIRWVDDALLGERRKKPVTVVDDYWLKEIIEHNAYTFGARAGQVAAEIFLERIREVFSESVREHSSWLSRPAIENHEQNHAWEGPENRFVEGLRDILLSWVDHNFDEAKSCVESILRGREEIVRRIGIHVLDQKWANLRSLYTPICDSNLFVSGHLHELYVLLRTRFEDFTETEKKVTIDAIRQLPIPDLGEDSERKLKRIQRNWLSAIAGKGYELADSWFDELMTNESIGSLSEHPDFHSYMESWSGPGPSPYRVQELLAFASEQNLVVRLNSFKRVDSWRGPTIRALVDTLEEAVAISPAAFLSSVSDFLIAKRPFQYGLINGFKRAWEAPAEKRSEIDWNLAWVRLTEFFENLIAEPDFWTETVVEDEDITPTRDWIPPIIAEFLRAGTRNDERAYPPHLIPRTWALIGTLLAKTKPLDRPSDDAMMQAINSPKGKVIEALFSHALRVCRLSDRAGTGHEAVWQNMKSIFAQELSSCKDGNYEFSTLTANYIANLQYIDSSWLQSNISNIFPREYPANFQSALEGLAYAPANRVIYSFLREESILDFAIRNEFKGRQSREKLVERIALAFLWGDEDLEGPLFSYFFECKRLDDLEKIADFFWSVSNQELSPDQVERILAFWNRCLVWIRGGEETPAKLLSKLGRLSCYVNKVEAREVDWLLAVAPYVHVGYNADNFIEQLDRLVDCNSAEICIVLGKLLETFLPTFDFQDRLKSLLMKLAQLGQSEKAIFYANQLRHLPGMAQLFAQLTD
jgi:hypothetical protein